MVQDGDKRSHSHRVLQKFAYLLSAYWVREALQAAFVISLARRSATTYGEFMLALSMGEILLFTAEFGLNQYLVPLFVREGRDLGDVLAQVTVLKGVLLLCGCIGMLGFVRWQGYSPSLTGLILAIGIGVGLEAITGSFFVSCQVQGRQDLEGKIKSLAAGLGFGYGLATLFSGAAPLVVALYKAVETLSNLGVVLFVTLKKARLTFRWPRLSQIWATGKGGMVFTLMALTTILYNKANMFFLQTYAGADGVAQYSVTWQMVDGISCLASNLLLKNVLFPLFVNLRETDVDELGRVVRNSASWLLAAAAVMMFVLSIESDRLIGLIYGPGYAEAIWMQRILVATIGISFLHNLAAYLMISLNKERLLLYFYAAGLIFNLLCCWLIIPGAPLMGTVLAIVLTKGFVALMTVSFCQVRFGLIPLKPLAHLAVAVAAGGCLYVFGMKFLLRELAEFLALLPTMGLAWRWWSHFSGTARSPVS